MKKPKRPSRLRTLVRKLDRRAESLADQREKLAQLEPGGTAARPIEVPSASLIEPRATGMACLRCNGKNRCAEHLATESERGMVREVRLECVGCGAKRAVYFQVLERLLN